MAFKDTLIDRIIDLEWDLFQQVRGIGGPASCQQDPETFGVMRRSQALAWSVETLESYLEDLRTAQARGRNLIAEKYARMMAGTDPEVYERIAPQLPELDAAAEALIDAIADIVIAWEEALNREYPNLMRRGRPLHSSADRPGVTSLETYLRGELATYSLRTLRRHLTHIESQRRAGVNGAAITLEQMVARSGYASLEAAEAKLGAAASGAAS